MPRVNKPVVIRPNRVRKGKLMSVVVGIKDVARAARVSVGTVSNVLNRPEAVSKERRERVERAIRELGYVPNDAARQLKAGISRAVGLVVLDSQNPFYASVGLAAENEAAGRGVGLFVANSHGLESREQFYLSLFEQQRARGILVTPGTPDLGPHREVARRGTRVVLVDAVDPEADFCTVSSDDFHGGHEAVQHLIRSGRRRIAIFGGPMRFRQIGRRRDGALAAAEEHGGVSIEYLDPGGMSILAGRHLAEEVVSRPPDERPDAIFAMNDLLATGALQAMVMQGELSVPGDVALVGYDDIDFCANAIVPISSVRQPAADMGRVAVQLLEREIEEGAGHQHADVALKPQLIIRESTRTSA